MKIIVFLLLLIITITLINPINVKANSNDDIVYEVVKRNPDLVITGCNETYVYWQSNYRIFNPPIAIRGAGYNESKYIDKIPGDYDSETIFIYDMLAAKYDLKYSNWGHYYDYLAEVRKEFYPLKEKLFTEKGDLGIRTLGIMDNYIPIVVVVTMYKITDKKVNTVLEYIRPFVKKYNAVVFFIEDYRPDSIYEKQAKALSRFYGKTLPNGTPTWGDGFIEYLNLVEEYYNFKINIQGWGFSPGIADLPIPPNATFNKEFVEKVVSILRKYAGCEVPLVANFLDYRERDIRPAILEPSGQEYSPLQFNQNNPETPKYIEPSYPSLTYLIILFLVIPVAILLPIILILRKVNNKKKKKF
jgi:hypothetical protein